MDIEDIVRKLQRRVINDGCGEFSITYSANKINGSLITECRITTTEPDMMKANKSMPDSDNQEILCYRDPKNA